MEKGKIIFLNGVSSSGKTTLAKILQERLLEPFFCFNMDTFDNMMRIPEKFYADDYFYNTSQLKILSVFHQTIKMFSDMGLNTIVDRVFVQGSNSLVECVELFHDYSVLFVHVICPLEELRRREKERGDRYIGQSEEQLSDLIPQDTYDITVDTYNNTTENCADKIIELLGYPEKFTAFKTLWSQYSGKIIRRI
ncbi:MAG: chloramphenicol phosphotransferase CPT family protein [Oscillospiraceae bacterium]|nr:chloramphenicol phosphotransferase CPT family protein [Oscillospiraceae bacterium]